jgi:hypothetical protein
MCPKGNIFFGAKF